ncbi:MFS transporter [Sphingobacterium spiritivorum]|uniref:Transporter, major facilitator family protein n=1 Tax=Sphingobacterium spiritivorum ATCC 33861 TaxID=525373 RepID=D7VP18_SPHSI|nr:MFS transporter [Sphingobacterium spiritivorum]EFK57665.1 transporter, major facilitator family protein [Sphingobacterium spiritivorum ATCC 33861]QQT36292.1 MFS transporter [Sphingobacterium spiritivorum]SUJ18528.1 Putative niacin/nicotinamide transporter NaiP [Sphingobacterium spiritivorum]
MNVMSSPSATVDNPKILNAAVIVAALGYFVDIYDLLLFSIVRVPSLQALGYSGEQLTNHGIFLLNIQMVGMLVGGIFWGILGDKKGRLSVLFGSICLYSIANIANGFVTTIEGYSLWRLVAGIGLAGELGAGITLVTEIMPKEKRGLATTIVASVGVSGAVAAYFVAQFFSWEVCYFIGGGLGLSLLALRIGVRESAMFAKTLHQKHASRGDFLSLFKDAGRFLKYLKCIIIGVPLWFVVGILITLSPEFGKVLGVQGEVSAGAAVACCYGGLVVGDILSGFLSQILKSRKKVVYVFLSLAVISVSAYFSLTGLSVTAFYFICFFLGLSVGYWVIFMTIAAEQFGTNIRATVTTTVPNFVRGAVVPLTILFQFLYASFDNLIYAGICVGLLCLLLAFWAIRGMQETFSKDLNYLEEEEK